MKNKKLILFLSIESILCLLVCIIGIGNTNLFQVATAFPFEQIGYGLRNLSISGYLGNIFATILFSIISLIPIIYFFYLFFRKNLSPEDLLLILLSIILFVSLYMLINPADIAKHFGSAEFVKYGKTIIGITIYTNLLGYILLKILRKVKISSTDKILDILKLLLSIVCVIAIFGISGQGLWQLIKEFEKLQIGNTALTFQDLLVSNFFLVSQYVVSQTPNFYTVRIILLGLVIIENFRVDQYGEEIFNNFQKMITLCQNAILYIIFSQIILNTLQLFLGANVRASNYTLTIPIMSIIFILVVMVFSRYFDDVRKLKDDNDMII